MKREGRVKAALGSRWKEAKVLTRKLQMYSPKKSTPCFFPQLPIHLVTVDISDIGK
jgi:hypothetical protein